jgi:simple sugar transport system permease protein
MDERGEKRTLGSRLLAIVYKYGLLIVLATMIVYFALTEPAFPTWKNTLVILQSVAITAIVALGVTASLAVDGFDLSIGSNVGFVVMLTGLAMVRFQVPGLVAVLIGLAAGALIGLFNGFLIVKARVPDLLATLGSLFVLEGLALILTSGQSVSAGMTVGGETTRGKFYGSFLWLGRGKVLGVPVPVIIMLILAVAMVIFLNRSRWGRVLYAIGGNREAARLAGIRVNRYRVAAYVISGVFASLGGVLLAARLGRGDVGAGAPFLLEAVAAALIGFAVLGANKPNAIGTAIGAVFVGVMINGLTMKNAPYYIQDFVKGALLVAALVLSFSVVFRKER